MQREDLDRIERELAIQLPEGYRAALLAFPVPACKGNSDTNLWDDASLLIEFNRELRAGAPGGVPPWPTHMFAVGHGGDGSPMAIDLRDPKNPVWWVEKCGLENSGSGATGQTFSEWLEQYVQDLRHDLESDGIDPEGSPEDRANVEARNANQGCSCLLLMIGIGFAVVVVFFVASNW